MTDEPAPFHPRLEAWLAVVSYYLHRCGVSDRDRARLRADLERDLRLALTDGATVEDLLAADPSDFARELAEADGVATTPLRGDHALATPSLIGTALLGAVAGMLASAVVVYPIGLRILDAAALSLSYAEQGVVAISLHVTAACLTTVVATAAVRWRFRFQQGVRRTALLTGAFLLLGGAASVAPTMALAASLGYPDDADLVALEVCIVVAFCLAGLGAARWVLMHTSPATSART